VLIIAAVYLTAATASLAQEAEATAVEVTGAAPGVLRQDSPVGPYGQPEWTTERAFGTSRVYVRPPGSLSLNHLWTPEFKDGKDEHSFREEVEIGLPYRLQLDLYQNWGIEEGDAFYKGSSVELRYALANWNKIPLNPTLYGEWTFNDAAPDKWELKLLLGQTFGPLELGRQFHLRAGDGRRTRAGGRAEQRTDVCVNRPDFECGYRNSLGTQDDERLTE
jgi:hypothetical protein